MSYHVDVIPNRNSPPAILFRQAQRDGKRIRRTTLANLSKLPPQIVDGIRAMLRGGQVYRPGEEAFCIRRSLPHGHVATVLGVCRQLGLERLLQRTRSRRRDLALAAIVARVLQPGSKLATARSLSPQSATSSLGALLGLGPVRGNEMLDMLDWLLGRQAWIEKSLARRHLEGATLLLYDVSSSYLEGRCSPLAAFGHNRDGKQGKQQIVFGLLCAADGCPVAVDVFAGNTADPSTVGVQVKKVQQRFGLESIALVGDRGMLTTARLRDDLEPAGLAWISALKTDAIRKLLRKPQLAVRPIFVYSEDHVRGHILLCMLAYYVEWHLRRRLAPLLADLGTLTLNQVTLPDAPQHPFPMVAKPTPLQAKAFDLLGVDPGKFVASKLAG